MKTVIFGQSKASVKRLFLVLAMSTAAVFGANGAQAQDAAGAPKIAVLDMASALFNSDRAKAVDAEIQAQTAEDQAKARSLGDQATALQEKLQKDEAVMSEDEKRKTAEQIQEIGVQYQFLAEKIQKLYNDRRQQFQETYAPNLIQAITAVLEEEQDKFDLVLRSEAVLHFEPEHDITARVTEKLNQQQ
jgi:outer membrane protein